MGSIQLGIQHAVGGLASKPERDLLMQDFMTVETTTFAADGSSQTPAHHYSEFTFKTYAPIAFRYFRDLFGIQPDDFLVSSAHIRNTRFVFCNLYKCVVSCLCESNNVPYLITFLLHIVVIL